MKSFLFLIFVFISAFISAQTVSDTLNFLTENYSQNNVRSVFDKQLSVYNLKSGLNFGRHFGAVFGGLNYFMNSTVTGSGVKNTKNERFLSLIGQYRFTPKLFGGLLIKNKKYNDERKLAINESEISGASLFMRFSPYGGINLLTFYGYLSDKQQGELDKGAQYGGEIKLDNPDFLYSAFRINSTFKFLNEDISPRKNTLRLFNTVLDSYITPELGNNALFHYSEVRKDFYFRSDSATAIEFDIINNIESRTEQNYYIQDKFVYSEPGSGFSFDFYGRAGWRNIDRNTRYVSMSNINASSFDTKVEEFRLDAASSAKYRTGVLLSSFKIEFAEKEEKYKAKPIDGADEFFFEERQRIESKKNNTSRLTTLSFSNNLALSRKDNLTISLLHRKLVYDTPSEENFDDRDELLTSFQIYYTRKYSPFFELFVNLDGSINHTVYIFAERSSNNNIKRVLRFAGGGAYKGSILRSKNRAEVSANYTVFDFEDLTPNFQSFSFRQFSLWDSSSVSITDRVSLNFLGYIKLSEQGDFLWSDFAGRPIRDLREVFALPKLSYRFNNLTFGFGIRYFRLQTFSYSREGIKNLSSEYRSKGPTSEIKYSIFDKLDITFMGWYEFITSEDNSKRELVNLNIRVNWNI